MKRRRAARKAKMPPITRYHDERALGGGVSTMVTIHVMGDCVVKVSFKKNGFNTKILKKCSTDIYREIYINRILFFRIALQSNDNNILG